uniref:uncharacterized protein LOC101313743 isoform X2 n=1 Tax=Fragaria vesca subsp. vesca TaxID=101020 RepID=UPI0005C88D86|nr:PREDICTED: uncharacterized protein LOC101313743 isoform X2 [Fragaria vesca subsp. vesca]
MGIIKESSPTYKYHVFLSFRGEDTRNNFTGHLYSALSEKGIVTFMDDQLIRGEEISPALIQAIEQSKISIVVFSENYASSKWCLDELVKILDCKKKIQQIVLPVFFKVDPSDVRNHRGSFGEGLANLERKFKDKDQVQEWKTTLFQAASLSGWYLDEHRSESSIIREIVERISKEDVEIQHRVQAIQKLLSVQGRDVHMMESAIQDMATLRIRDIMPRRGDIKIKVRVCRMWRGKIYQPIEKPEGLGCVLVDEHGDSIHAWVKEADVEDVLDSITEGSVYEITKFSTMKNQKAHKVVPHIAQLLFNNKTVFKLIIGEVPAIPKHCFHLMDYNELPARKNIDILLSDVIGLLTWVRPVKDVTIDGRLTKKRELTLQNTRNEDLKVALWGDLALGFETNKVFQIVPPVVIVITGTKVRPSSDNIVLYTSMRTRIFLDPNIPEVQEYKARFSRPRYAPKLASSSTQITNRVDVDSANMITISDLLLHEPTENKESTFTCRAKITKILFREGWYYLGCPTCKVKLQMGSGSALDTCPHHGEQVGVPIYKLEVRLEDEDGSASAMLMGKSADALFGITCGELVNSGNSDKTIIPEVMKDSKNKYKIWYIGYGTKNDFMVRGVYTDSKETDSEKKEPLTSEKSSSKRKLEAPNESTLNQLPEFSRKTKRVQDTKATPKSNQGLL